MNNTQLQHYIKRNMLGGLVNIGNTCYFNTALQCLYNVNDLNNYLLFNKEFKSELRKDSIEKPFTLSYYETYQILLSNNYIKPVPLLKQMLILCHQRNIPCRLGNQEDSQEYLLYILDFIHESLKHSIDFKYEIKISNDLDKQLLKSSKIWNNSIKDDYSIIVNLFYGQFMYDIYTEDDTEKSLSRTYEKFNSISLPITDDTKNIYDCFNVYIHTIFNGENQYYYEEEDKKINAIRKCMIWRLPKYLILSFKRFNYGNRKNNQEIQFPINDLNLSEYTHLYNKYKSSYDLISIGCHRGGTEGGHYYSITRKSENIWFLYNDESVSKISDINKAISNVLNDVYILIYKKKIDTIELLSDTSFNTELDEIKEKNKTKLFINSTDDEVSDETDKVVDETDEVVDETDEVVDETDEVVDETDEVVDETDEVVDEVVDETDEIIDYSDLMIQPTQVYSDEDPNDLIKIAELMNDSSNNWILENEITTECDIDEEHLIHISNLMNINDSDCSGVEFSDMSDNETDLYFFNDS